jgi:replicative DNA helicase
MSAERKTATVRTIDPPPHHLDVEAALMGLVLLGEVAPADLSPLRPEHLYGQAHRHILDAVLSLAAEGAVIDAVVVAGRLRETDRLTDVGGVKALGAIVDAAPALASIPEAVRQIVDAWARREAGTYAARVVASCRRHGPDTAEMLHQAKAKFDELLTARDTSERPTDLLSGYQADMLRVQDAANATAAYVSTGYAQVDQAMNGGWWCAKLAVIGARPGLGKTTVGLKAALSCAQTPVDAGGGGALIVSVELPGVEMRQRILSHESHLTAAQVRAPSSDHVVATMTGWLAHLCQLPLWVEDRAKTITAIRASVRRHVRLAEAKGAPLRVVVLDYLQLIRSGATHKSRQEEITEVCQQVVAMRDEHPNVSFLVLAQLNRESSDGRKPRDSDLRECGQVEQDADTIALLWRPEKDDPNTVEMVFAKNRGLRLDVAPRFKVDTQCGRLVEEVQP